MLKKIMEQGGYAVIIAVVAMTAYLTAMYFADKYFDKVTQSAYLDVDAEGNIFVSGFETEEDEVIYVLWETDAGSIRAAQSDETFSSQYEDGCSLGYYVNSALDGRVTWSGADADGYEYEKATVRAVLYRYNPDENNSVFYMGDYVNEFTVTVSASDGTTVKEADDRYFSNPVRSGSDGEWSQIYAIYESDEEILYRYRTGREIDDDLMALCWEADSDIMRTMDIKSGFFPKPVSGEEKSGFLAAVNIITLLKTDISAVDFEIFAYLIDEDAYDEYDENRTKIADESKKLKAEISQTVNICK